jgi:hypothetical protein
MMGKVFVGLFMMLALSSFVFAASSEVAVDFSVDVPTGEVSKYIPSKNIVGDCLGYVVLAFIVLAFVYFALKKKGSARKSAPSKKGTKASSSSRKKKKVSKSKK